MSTSTKDRGQQPAAPRRQLTLLDSTSIIVGIIIGSTIYESAPLIASSVPDTAWLVAVWILGGVLSLVGALCYVELANAYPKEGGDYVYLTRAMGRRLGFLFAWAQLWVVRPGSIGALAYVFARYAHRLWPLGSEWGSLVTYAALSVAVMTAINLLGIQEGKWTQNVLALAKYLGLLAVVGVGCFLVGAPGGDGAAAAPGKLDLGLAMIFIFYAYGGWNEMAYVGSEVRDPKKNILRALVLGTVGVTLLYVLLNLAFVHALGFEGTQHSKEIAADVLARGIGEWGARLVSLLICVSALGAINGMIFTGARICYAMGNDHKLYSWLGRWNARRDTPVQSLLIQTVITLALVIGFGLSKGGDTLNARGFDKMVMFTAPVFWFFFLLVGIAVFVLRYRQPDLPRPYRVPLYPVVPIIFCLSSAYMVYSSLVYAIGNKSYEALWSVGILAVGLALSFYDPEPNDRGLPESPK